MSVNLTVERIEPPSPNGMPRREPVWLVRREDGSVVKEVHDHTLGLAFDTLTAEIKRLRSLVKNAYREGWEDGQGICLPDEVVPKSWSYSFTLYALQPPYSPQTRTKPNE